MEEKRIEFTNWVYTFGRYSSLFLVIMMVGLPIISSALYGFWPSLKNIWPMLLVSFFQMGPYWPSETIGYMPAMGPGALYISYIAGNVTNLRLPATMGTLRILGIEPNTEKSHIMAIIAAGASIITTVSMCFIAVIISGPLEPLLSNPSIRPAFTYVIPALFGNLVAQNILNSKKDVLFFLPPVAINVVLTRYTGLDWSIPLMLGLLVGAVLYIGDYLHTKAKKAEA